MKIRTNSAQEESSQSGCGTAWIWRMRGAAVPFEAVENYLLLCGSLTHPSCCR
jgi:hypothetical protein